MSVLNERKERKGQSCFRQGPLSQGKKGGGEMKPRSHGSGKLVMTL